eukprot:CAMPEP_0202959666 /NCGR_PEP_ID=MMETSP1396-20130829/3842_1 /ASSEMBLY_ACC=CAM_ASM_000872 /TAXON_ID= /ORGANISM="Pseudokeronopsis sp., Strain Brazil" /LENGTH=54 /DNA_ID=CAMNT_0049678351 /DNA_START=471 /DNA_END=635 /DNA_ORIENTATION=-
MTTAKNVLLPEGHADYFVWVLNSHSTETVSVTFYAAFSLMGCVFFPALLLLLIL